MGDQSVSKFADPVEKRVFTKYILNDLKALEKMLEEDLFEKGIQRIGAEQELCLVGPDYRPSMAAMEILDRVDDEHFTTEMGLYNLEINLDPILFRGDCFSKMERQLVRLLNKAKKHAEKENAKVVLTGILPTIRRKEIRFEYMTPNPRYKALNDIIKAQKGGDFELNITGIDELVAKHENILFEACNTSFQVHLQIDPNDFVDQYNWSQVIAGPVLSVAANSPLLLGRRLWSETRIALFKQSVDSRNAASLHRESEPRVGFGKAWLRETPVNIFKENLSRYNLLFASDVTEDAMQVLEDGGIPKLNALRMHNGTVYTWNRVCYGVSNGKPHFRIENRYIPSGPTVVDEIANSAFWLGLMKGMPEKYKDIPSQMNFEDARYNFYNAARTDLDSRFKWFGEVISSTHLIRTELLPIAKKGLQMMKVKEEDIKKYLGIIKRRVDLHVNGATWTNRNFTELLKVSTANEASAVITKMMAKNEEVGKPVHLWKNVDPLQRFEQEEFRKVGDIMSTDIYTVTEDESVELMVNVMDWHKVRYVPVENEKNELVGMVTPGTLIRSYKSGKVDEMLAVKDIMRTEIISIDSNTPTSDAISLMVEKDIGCLPVVDKKKLIGLLTQRHVLNVVNLTKKFE